MGSSPVEITKYCGENFGKLASLINSICSVQLLPPQPNGDKIGLDTCPIRVNGYKRNRGQDWTRDRFPLSPPWNYGIMVIMHPCHG